MKVKDVEWLGNLRYKSLILNRNVWNWMIVIKIRDEVWDLMVMCEI